MMEAINELLSMEPLSDDAEERLAAIIETLPPDIQEVIEMCTFEALAVRRGQEGPEVNLYRSLRDSEIARLYPRV